MVTQTKGSDLLVSQAKGVTSWSLKQTCQLLVCVLQPSYYFKKMVPTAEKRYMPTLSDCIPTTYNRRRGLSSGAKCNIWKTREVTIFSEISDSREIYEY